MTFKILTFGCKVNSYESQALRERLLKQGYVESENADIYFVNTCAVTNEAERKDLKLVRDLVRDHPSSKVVVLGCSSQIHKEKYLKIEGVCSVLGVNKKIASDLDFCLKNKDLVPSNTRKLFFEETPIANGYEKVRAYLKIQDGCNNFCSYCVVPFTRGNSRSRNKDEILKEAENLLDNGYKELVIGGIDTGSYQDPLDSSYRLKDLLKDLISIKGHLFRIRVSSIEESQIDDEYIALFKSNPQRLCPHFHLPLQSGSEKILKLMNRKYDLQSFENTILKIRKEIPYVALSCDVITGFPGETEEDFQSTYDFLKSNLFMRIHAFPYSERPLTRAISFKDSVPRNIRLKRVRILNTLSKENEKQYRELLKGRQAMVLYESRARDGSFSGYSENYLQFRKTTDEDIEGCFIAETIS
ncbi:MAG: tRNA (N(6)-L-threonylcarbamoyladenosine(37)-C(2))-methylthiotransferase MtaB [Bacilli bacterium]